MLLTRLTLEIFPDFTAVHAFALSQLCNLQQLVVSSEPRGPVDSELGTPETALHAFLPDFWQAVARFPRLTELVYAAEYLWPSKYWLDEDQPIQALPASAPLKRATISFDAATSTIQSFLERSGVQRFGLLLGNEESPSDVNTKLGMVPFRHLESLQISMHREPISKTFKCSFSAVTEHVLAQAKERATSLQIAALQIHAEWISDDLEFRKSFAAALELCELCNCKDYAFTGRQDPGFGSEGIQSGSYALSLQTLKLEFPFETTKTGDVSRLIELLPRLPSLVHLQIRCCTTERYEWRKDAKPSTEPRLLEMDDRAIAQKYPDIRKILDYLAGTQVKTFSVKGSEEQGSARWQKDDVSKPFERWL